MEFIKHNGFLYRQVKTATDSLMSRFDSLIRQMFVARGGYNAGIDTAVSIIERVMEFPYIGTNSRKKTVALHIYRKYYLGR